MIQGTFLRLQKWFVIFSVGLMVILLTVLSASAQDLVWEPTNGPYGRDIRALLATSDGALYAGTFGGGVFRSDDSGKSWSETSLQRFATSFAVFGEILYAGTMEGGVFRSENNGNSWIPINKGLTNTAVRSLVVAGNTLFAGTSGGIFRSKDMGNTWIEVNKGLTHIDVKSLAIFGNTLFAGTSGGVFRSEDMGNTWIEVNKGLTNTDVCSLVVLDKTLYVGTFGGGVFRAFISNRN